MLPPRRKWTWTSVNTELNQSACDNFGAGARAGSSAEARHRSAEACPDGGPTGQWPRRKAGYFDDLGTGRR
jgi:hypothetical protein